jgi:hypothetical protein
MSKRGSTAVLKDSVSQVPKKQQISPALQFFRRKVHLVMIICKIWNHIFNMRVADLKAKLEQNRYRNEPNGAGQLCCSVCKIFKAPEEYNSNKSTKTGLYSSCKSCSRGQSKIQTQKRKQARRVKTPKLKQTETHKTCKTCLQFLPLKNFTKGSRNLGGYVPNCRACISKKTSDRDNTLEGKFSKLHSSANGHSRDRGMGRISILPMDIANVYSELRGRCSISGRILDWTQGSLNLMSLERLDNDQTYLTSNMTLILHRMNTGDSTKQIRIFYPDICTGNSQWNETKWVEFHTGHKQHESPEYLAYLTETLDLVKIPKKKGGRINKALTVDTNPTHLTCTHCDELKPISHFKTRDGAKANQTSKKYRHKCELCRLMRANASPAFFFHKLVKQAQNRATYRKKIPFNLTFENVKQKILEQHGLCAISGHRLEFKRYCNYQCSIERIDNSRGYTIDNIQLICLEFQSTDTCQWTRDIYMDLFWPCGGSENATEWKYQRY